MMEIGQPLRKGFVIYSKSKCSFCVKVKQLLNDNNITFEDISCDEYLLNDVNKELFLSFIKDQAKREYRTFPMVFYDGQFVGGYTDTELFINKDLLRFDDNSF